MAIHAYARLWLCTAVLSLLSCTHETGTAQQTPASERFAPLGAACLHADQCSGDLFCDRGLCQPLYTPWFGHGYGAQCVADIAYPDGAMVHCRDWPCIDGHCSSCVTDAECGALQRCTAQTNLPGKRCIIPDPSTALSEPACGGATTPACPWPTDPEMPSPAKITPSDPECRNTAECGGDRFCDRGRCQWVDLTQYGHGLGAVCRRNEAPSLTDTCLGYLCIDGRCSTCLDDSECYASAPFCIHSPYHPHGPVCSRREQSFYFDEAGALRAEHAADYENFASDYLYLQSLREQAGLRPNQLPDAPQLTAADAHAP
jgi:hypothetical protein